MKIKIIIMILLLLSFVNSVLYALTKEVSLKKYDEVELVFSGVTLDNISFYPKNDLITEWDKHENVKIETKRNLICFSSEDKAEVSLWLPDDKTYIYRFRDEEDVICKFNNETVIFSKEGDKVLTYKDGEFFIKDDEDNSAVKICKEGIFVTEGDEKVEISSEGIIVQSEDEDVNLTGFWGKLLGGFIKVVVNAGLSTIGDTPEEVAKSIINSDLKEGIDINIIDDSK